MIACLLLGLIGICAPLTGSTAVSGRIDTVSSATTPSTAWNQIDPVLELILRLIEILDRIEQLVIQKSPEARLEDPVNLDLLAELNDAQAEIDQLLDPLQSPNLDPVDAGDVERIWPPSTLEAYAATTLALANEAHAAAISLSQPFRDEAIGSKIKTIDSLMPGFYAAGGF